MTPRRNWKRKLKKNWKTWLLSLFMALILLSGGVSTILRGRRAAARRQPTVTATATLAPSPSATPESAGIQLTATPTATLR